MARHYVILFLSLLISPAARSDVQIVASIKPLQLIASAIIHATDSVTVLIPENQSPHHYNLKPSDRIALDAADLVIWVGPSLETFLLPVMAQLESGTRIVALEQLSGIKKLAIRHSDTARQTDQLDPHLWLDPQNAAQLARILTDSLSALNPGNAVDYQHNLDTLLQQLDRLDNTLRNKFMEVNTAPYIVYHDAFQYLESYYGLAHGMALVDDPEISPGMRAVMNTRQQIRRLEPVCLFTDISANPALVRTLLAGYPLMETPLDILGSQQSPGPDSYATMMQDLAASIYNCLSGARP
jgi:zinc transport system substrate-binding protein